MARLSFGRAVGWLVSLSVGMSVCHDFLKMLEVFGLFFGEISDLRMVFFLPFFYR